MEENWARIIEAIGEDLARPGLVDTPKRAAKAFEFLTRGYHQSVDEVVNEALFPSDSSEMILVQDVELYSLCEHHMLPFIGKCHVAYIPSGKVIGLSVYTDKEDIYRVVRNKRFQELLNRLDFVIGVERRQTHDLAIAVHITQDKEFNLLISRIVFENG